MFLSLDDGSECCNGSAAADSSTPAYEDAGIAGYTHGAANKPGSQKAEADVEYNEWQRGKTNANNGMEIQCAAGQNDAGFEQIFLGERGAGLELFQNIFSADVGEYDADEKTDHRGAYYMLHVAEKHSGNTGGQTYDQTV